MNTNGRTDSIDALLASHAEARIEDNGFSARVSAALPPRRTAASPWLKPALVLGATIAGAGIATFVAPIGPTLLAGFVDLTVLGNTSPAALTSLLAAISLAVSAFVLIEDAG